MGVENLSEISHKINLLRDILDRKFEYLRQIYNITENQEMFEKTLNGDDKKILLGEAVKEKQKIIESVIAADNLFLKLFSEFRGQLNENQQFFHDEILQLQQKIRKIADMDFKIRAKELYAKQGVSVQKNVFSEKIKVPKTSKNYILEKYRDNTKKM